MKKILLTGSTGFIGSEILKSLPNNYKIYITLRKRVKNLQKNKFNSDIIQKSQSINQKLKKIKLTM